MKKNQIFIYNTPKLSFISNGQSELSSDNEIKVMTKSKLPNKLLNKKLKIDTIVNNDIDIISSKKISDNSMNKLNTKRTHFSDEFNSINEQGVKNVDILDNKNIMPENFENNINKNKKLKKYLIFEKNKNTSDIDNINDKMIESNNFNEIYFKKNIDKYNFNDIDRSERGLKEDKNIKEKTEEESPEENIKKNEIIYDNITGYNIDCKVIYDNLKLFFFNPIPINKTLSTNINIRNEEFKNKSTYKNMEKNNIEQELNNNMEVNDLVEDIKTYDFDLEILRNHQIYYFGKIFSYLPYMVIKIYISDNFTKYGEINQQRVKDSNFYCVGKIESNFLRTEFNVYKGNDKNSYQKVLNINYSINIFGLFGVRVMKVDKYENNQLLYSFKNELPKWDNEFKIYKLNFNGRVKMTSKKNFILRQNEENILQCGKINDNSFALDFITPLSPFESFCISITSLVNKKACE